MKKYIIIIGLVLVSIPSFSQATRRSKDEKDRTSRKSTQLQTRKSTSSRSDRERTEKKSFNRSFELKEKLTRDKINRSDQLKNNRPNIERRRYENKDTQRQSRSYERKEQLNKNYRSRPVRTYRNIKPPLSLKIRKARFPYRVPVHIEIIWTPRLIQEYYIMYPSYRHWNIRVGIQLGTISAYDALYHIGEVRRIYGQVFETWYSPETLEYYLYFGAPFPYHDFSVIIPRRLAKRFSYSPLRFFHHKHICVTGLLTLYDNKPEIVIKKRNQINLYYD